MNTISKGELYSFNNDSSIYKLNANDSLIYYLSMPNRDITNCDIYIGFPGMDMSYFTSTQMIEEINRLATPIHQVNPDGLYVFCNLPYNELYEASNDNDDKLYGILFNKLQLITSDLFSTLSFNNTVTINPQIFAVKQNNVDMKFIDWLELRLNDFIAPGGYKNLIKEANKVPVTTSLDDAGNSDFGTRGNSGGPSLTKSDVKTKKLVKPQSGRKGFSSFAFIVLLVTLSLFMGIGLAYLLLK